MNDKPIKILLIEDNPGDARLFQEMLVGAGGTSFDLEQTDRLSAGLERLVAEGIDIILSDLSLPDSHGFDTFAQIQARAPQVPIIVLSGLDDEAMAMKAVRQGAQDYLVKGKISGHLLVRAIRYAIERKRAERALEDAYAEVEKRVEERTAELKQEIIERRRAEEERERLQQKVIETQKRTLRELATPIIPIMERIIVTPLIGSIDAVRARDITRALLAGIREHRAEVVILDITGVPTVDGDVLDHLTKTIQAARLKGAHTIVTGISAAVAETVVDLGIDWSDIETLSDLQTGLRVALAKTGRRIEEDAGPR